MLPERANRELLLCPEENCWQVLPAGQFTLSGIQRFWAESVVRTTSDQPPQTLTGDAWIAAMDRQMEQALEAIY